MRLLLAALVALAACSSGPMNPADADVRFEVDGVDVRILGGAALAADTVGVDLRDVAERSIETVAQVLELPPMVMIVRVQPSESIPGIGVGASTDPRTGDVTISLDPSHDHFDEVLVARIPDTIAHELHHSVRFLRGPGRGKTLLDGFVNEGLGQHFSVQVFPELEPAPWTAALTTQEEREAWTAAEGALRDPLSLDGLRTWFFGTGDVPRWTGYTIGFNLVGAYLEAEDTTAAEAVAVDADEIFERSGYAP